MLTWLLVFGVGGCWSGYTDATVIQAPDRDTAWRQGLDIALKETADERRLSFKGLRDLIAERRGARRRGSLPAAAI